MEGFKICWKTVRRSQKKITRYSLEWYITNADQAQIEIRWNDVSNDETWTTWYQLKIVIIYIQYLPVAYTYIIASNPPIPNPVWVAQVVFPVVVVFVAGCSLMDLKKLFPAA